MIDKSIIDNLNKRYSNSNIYISNCELGLCIRATRNIKKGEIIYAFEGPTITFDETIKRGEKECMSLQYDHDKYIDTQAPGMYFNHSCQPNAGIVNDFDLITLEDISAHSEIRFDYSTTMDENHFQMECKCGTPLCRKLITDFKLLPSNIKKKYLDMGIVMSFINRQYLSKA